MGDNKEFWLVWNPTGHRPPTHQHLTVDSAEREANRLAANAPGERFYVLKALGLHRTAEAPVERIELEANEFEDDEIPF